MRRALILVVSGFLTIALLTASGEESSAKLKPFAWLSGSWIGTRGPFETEELWILPKGGLMLGLHREVHRESNRASFEFLRIEARADGVYYLASPSGKSATPFRLVESSEKKVVFENPDHDFPKRIIYTLASANSLIARVEGDGGKVLEWRWKREK